MLYDTFMRTKMKNISHNPIPKYQMPWKDIQTIVRDGAAAEYFSIGDQLSVEKLSDITVDIGNSIGIKSASVDANKFISAYGKVKAKKYQFVYNDKSWQNSNGNKIALANYGISVTGIPIIGDTIFVTETTTHMIFDIIGIDHDIPTDTNYTHSMTLQLSNIIFPTMRFDSPEATWYIDETAYPDGLAAGTYHFTTANEDTYHFTLANAVPVGGQIIYDYNSTVKTYAAIGSTTELESVTVESDALGTELPSITNNGITATTNSENRTRYGSNNWIESSLRQWLNSDKDEGAWWEPKTNFDRPSDVSIDGFLKGIDPSFLSVIGYVTKKTQLSVSDDYDLATSSERFFLLSRSEVYGGTEFETNGADGNVYPYYDEEHSDLTAPGIESDSNRIKYVNDTANYQWLRTSNISDSYRIRYITATGSLAISGARNRYSVAPACTIV